MTRKFKTLGLTLVAVFAFAAIMAASASATEFTSTGGTYPVTFHGEQPAEGQHVFTADEKFETTCKIATFSGELQAKSTTATAQADYTDCTSSNLGANVTMNGCDYLFHLGATGNLATVDIVCPEGKEITIDAGAGACVIHIPPRPAWSTLRSRTVPFQ